MSTLSTSTVSSPAVTQYADLMKRPVYRKGVMYGIILLATGCLFNSVLIDFFARQGWLGWTDWAYDGGILSALFVAFAIVLYLTIILWTVVYQESGSAYLHSLVFASVVASLIWASGSSQPLIALHSTGLVTLFLLLTVLLESHNATGAITSLEKVIALTPGYAHRLGVMGIEDVDPDTLQVGDQIEVRPGEMIYGDGVINEGRSSIDESKITGESIPVDKGPGDKVYAGSLNLNGRLIVQIEKVGIQTTLGQVKALIQQARSTQLKVAGIIDVLLRYYVPVVFMLTIMVWLGSGYDLTKTVAFLVVSCPAALVLATPTVALAALATGARSGILLKKVSDIEILAKVDSIILDKTGTLTEGSPCVTGLVPLDPVDSATLLQIAATAEQSSNHPIALAIMRLAEEVHMKPIQAQEIVEVAGRGVKVTCGQDTFVVGNRIWMEEHQVNLDILKEMDIPPHQTVLLVAKNGQLMGWIELEDQIRPDASDLIHSLRNQWKLPTWLVSGDRKSVCEKVAKSLGIEYVYGECTPVDKAEIVDQLKKDGKLVMFVGDGVNDGPALAASHVGVAMGSKGSDLALETASVAILSNQLNRIPFLFTISRSARWIIFQNLVGGTSFVGLGMTMALLGWIQPWSAALLQLLGALFSILNSARLLRVLPEDKIKKPIQ